MGTEGLTPRNAEHEATVALDVRSLGKLMTTEFPQEFYVRRQVSCLAGNVIIVGARNEPRD
jgi:hypothetical protein